MNASDWLLLTVAAAEGESMSPVQLQKTLFLMGKEVGARRLARPFYKFVPYDYGVFCADIYSDAEFLDSSGLVEITYGGRYKQYSATGEGLAEAAVLRESANDNAIEFLDSVVKWVRSLSFDELVRAMYKKYPETKKRSVFRG
jgi:hypothetical protein